MAEPATPLPWKEYHGDIVADGDRASDYDDYVIAGIGVSRGARSSVYCPVRAHKPEGKANTAYIVHACNTYPALLEALDFMFDTFGGHLSDADYSRVEATLKQAKEG